MRELKLDIVVKKGDAYISRTHPRVRELKLEMDEGQIQRNMSHPSQGA